MKYDILILSSLVSSFSIKSKYSTFYFYVPLYSIYKIPQIKYKTELMYYVPFHYDASTKCEMFLKRIVQSSCLAHLNYSSN